MNVDFIKVLRYLILKIFPLNIYVFVSSNIVAVHIGVVSKDLRHNFNLTILVYVSIFNAEN